jgi:hypothetical protein
VATPNAITTSQATRLTGIPDAPWIVDVRVDDDHNADPRMLPGSVRCSQRTVSAWARGSSPANSSRLFVSAGRS